MTAHSSPSGSEGGGNADTEVRASLSDRAVFGGDLPPARANTERPKRIQLSRAKGWKMPPNTVKVDRSTKWGNPYEVWFDENEGQWTVSVGSCNWPVPDKDGGIALAVKKHHEFMLASLAKEIYPSWFVLRELRGKNLACWCKPGDPCHADVLLELANSPESIAPLASIPKEPQA